MEEYLLVTFLICVLGLSVAQQDYQFCEGKQGTLTTSTGISAVLRTSYPAGGVYEYSNDNGNCGCRLTVSGDAAGPAVIRVSSRLTIPAASKSSSNNNSTCGPIIMASYTSLSSGTAQTSVLAFQCPLLQADNDTASYYVHVKPGENVMFALVNNQISEVKSQINITLVAGNVSLQCGQQASVTGCPCSYRFEGPSMGDTKLASRFIAAIVASVGFLVLCGIIFCIYVFCKNRKAKKQEAEEGRLPDKSKVDGAENQGYSGSQKSIPDSKPSKPDKKPRTKLSPEKSSPGKPEGNNMSHIPYNSEDALNLSLQQPYVNTNPSGLGSIIGTADVRGSTESGIYSSADLIGPDQMYGRNGTPHRTAQLPRSRSKEELEAMYAKPSKEYYSNVPGASPHQTAALPARSASQDRLDGRRGSQDRLDQTSMPQRSGSQDRLASVNVGFVPEHRPQHGSQHSLDETDV